MLKYASLIVDIKNSRAYKQADRIDIQKYIKECILKLNNIFEASIKLDMIFSGGDEVQGLFYSPVVAYLYFRLFSMLIAPVQVRAGIGVGEWSIKINSGNSTEQDGPVYHNAKFAIESADDRLGYELLLYSGEKYDIFINSQINVSTLLVNKQSEYQNQLLLLTELMYPIIINNAYNTKKLSQLIEIIRMKNELLYYSKWNQSRTIRQRSFSEWQIDFIEAVDIHTTINSDKSFYESAGKIRGLATKLADITNTRRQTVEKSLKSGNIFQIRNACIVALKQMEYHRLGV